MAIINPMMIAQGIGQTISGFVQHRAMRLERDRQREFEDEARDERNRLKGVYESLDTSNPYVNMENAMEDLTINQQQAQFEKQTFQQSQANIMQTLQGAAGGSGIAALAQSLSQQGQIAAQKSSASIGQQESRNIAARASESSRLQEMQRRGQRETQQMEMQKIGSLQQMSQQEMVQSQQLAAQSEQARAAALGNALGGITTAATGFSGTPEMADKEGYIQI